MPARFTPGQIFAGRYRMIELLGHAAMGDVWQADDLVLETPVALKILPIDGVGRRELVLNEVRLARQITHPAVRRVFDVGEVDGEAFLSMELVSGEDLAALLKRAGRLTPEKVNDIAHQLCGGLAAAHAQGVLHRDLTPANILIDDRGEIHILDFGIAVPSAPDAQTDSGSTPGTDIYALGLVLFELLTGRHPFAIPDTARQRKARPPRPSQLVGTLDARLENAIMAALSPNPRDRPASAAALEALLPPLGEDPRARVSTILSHRWAMGFAIGAVAIAVAFASTFFISAPSVPLAEGDTIILADIANATTDPVFDRTLKQALAVALEESPFLQLLGDDRTQETLRLMGRSGDTRVTAQIAREIAQREGLKAVLTGSISSLGRNFVISLEALNAQTGEVMAREQVEAEGKERVLGALGNAASRLRESLGESLPSIQRFNTPPERATTASLEALKAYSTAVEHLRAARALEAVPYLKRAIELDPEFALAYAELSRVYTNTQQPALAPPLSEKAFALRDRVSERERHLISWRYHRDATQNWEKALDVARAWTTAYPREAAAFNSLGLASLELGRHDEAIAAFNQARSVDPSFMTPYLNLGFIYTRLGQYEQARQALQYAVDRGTEGSTLSRDLYALAFVRNDTATMDRLEREASNTLEEYASFNWRGRREGFLGRVQSAHDAYRQGIQLATSRGLVGPAAQMEAEDAEIHAVVGQCDAARREAAAGVALSRDNFTMERASRALAWCGAFAESAVLTKELAIRFPEATQTLHRWLPITAAATAMRRGDPVRTVELLTEVRELEAGAQFWPAYLRGLAFQQQKDVSNARAQLQFIIDHRGYYMYSPLYPLAHLELARVATKDGAVAQAREAYDAFLALWKDADANLPQMIAARQERASLK